MLSIGRWIYTRVGDTQLHFRRLNFIFQKHYISPFIPLPPPLSPFRGSNFGSSMLRDGIYESWNTSWRESWYLMQDSLAPWRLLLLPPRAFSLAFVWNPPSNHPRVRPGAFVGMDILKTRGMHWRYQQWIFRTSNPSIFLRGFDIEKREMEISNIWFCREPSV